MYNILHIVHSNSNTYTYTHIYIYICICIYVYMYICIYVYMYICIYVYMYICIYVYIHITLHIHLVHSIHISYPYEKNPAAAGDLHAGHFGRAPERHRAAEEAARRWETLSLGAPRKPGENVGKTWGKRGENHGKPGKSRGIGCFWLIFWILDLIGWA